MLQYPSLDDYMKTIGIEQSLCNRSSYEHKCLNNIKNIDQHAGKCNNKQNLKDILDYAMMSTPEDVRYDSPSLPMTSTPVKKSIAGKSLCLFTNIFDIKKKTSKRWVGAEKSKRRWGNCASVMLPLCFCYASEQRRYILYLWEQRHVRMAGTRASKRYHRKCANSEVIFDHNIFDNTIDN